MLPSVNGYVYASGYRELVCVLLIPRLESFKCERYVCLLFASVPWLSWLSNAAQYFGYHQTSHVLPFTRVMFKDNGIFQDLQKLWVPGMVWMFFF